MTVLTDPYSESVQAFLGDRKLERPDGRPLYAYKCTPAEYHFFEDVLREERTSLINGHNTRSAPQVFCLWASEWWRRHHVGGSWKWETLLDVIEAHLLAPGQPYYVDLQRIVARGLSSWHRELLRTGHGRAFLITLACEGGLPLNLVKREQAGLRRYFRALIEEFQSHGQFGYTGTELAERVSGYLPRSLRHGVVFGLSGRLIQQIVDLQPIIGNSETPVADLDRKDPDWRNRLPLRVDDKIAGALLNNLVADAALITRLGAESRIRWERELVFGAGSWWLEGGVAVPASLSPADLRGLLDLGEDDALPGRFNLSLAVADDPPVSLALATRRTGKSSEVSFTLSHAPGADRVWQGEKVTGRPKLTVRTPLFDHVLPTFRGANDLSSLPWVFEPPSADMEAQRLRFVGEGSVRCASPWVLVATALDTTSQVGAEGGELEEIGTLLGGLRQLWRLSGSATFSTADGTASSVQTGHEAPTTDHQFRYSGRRKTLGLRNEPVFLGLPLVLETPRSGFTSAVPESDLSWRPAHVRGPWRRWSERCLGDVEILVGTEGEVRFLGRVTVLPRAVGVELGGSTEVGTITFNGWESSEINVAPPADCSSALEHVEPNCTRVRLSTELSVPPDSFEVHVAWPNDCEALLTLPFPIYAVQFRSPGGIRLPSGSEVGTDVASGVTISLVAPRRGAVVNLELIPRPGGEVEDIARYRLSLPFQEVSAGHYTIDLAPASEAIQFLLSLGSEIDSSVLARVQSNDLRDLPPDSLEIRRYDLTLVLDPDLQELRIDDAQVIRVEPAAVSRMRAVAVSLIEPDDEFELDCSRPGSWRLPESPPTEVPWVVLLFDGDWCRARPWLWRAPLSESVGDEEVESSEVATFVSHPRSEALIDSEEEHHVEIADWDLISLSNLGTQASRVRGMTRALQQLTLDPFSAEWDRVDRIIRRTVEVAPSCFDLLQALVHCPDALVVWALRAPEDALRIGWHQLTQFPFLWEALPARAWQIALITWHSAGVENLRELPENEDLLVTWADSVQKGVRRLVDLQPSLHAVFAITMHEKLELALPPDVGLTLQPGTLSIFLKDIPSMTQDVAHRHLERWPTGLRLPSLLNRCREAVPSPSFWDAVTPSSFPTFQNDVLLAPVVSAVVSAMGWTVLTPEINEIRRMRHFDPEWFEDCYATVFPPLFGLLHQLDSDLHD